MHDETPVNVGVYGKSWSSIAFQEAMQPQAPDPVAVPAPALEPPAAAQGCPSSATKRARRAAAGTEEKIAKGNKKK